MKYLGINDNKHIFSNNDIEFTLEDKNESFTEFQTVVHNDIDLLNEVSLDNIDLALNQLHFKYIKATDNILGDFKRTLQFNQCILEHINKKEVIIKISGIFKLIQDDMKILSNAFLKEIKNPHYIDIKFTNFDKNNFFRITLNSGREVFLNRELSFDENFDKNELTDEEFCSIKEIEKEINLDLKNIENCNNYDDLCDFIMKYNSTNNITFEDNKQFYFYLISILDFSKFNMVHNHLLHLMVYETSKFSFIDVFSIFLENKTLSLDNLIKDLMVKRVEFLPFRFILRLLDNEIFRKNANSLKSETLLIIEKLLSYESMESRKDFYNLITDEDLKSHLTNPSSRFSFIKSIFQIS